MPGKVVTRLTSGNDIHVISSSFYGTCSTAENTRVKEVVINNPNINKITLVTGMLLSVKFVNSNTAANPALEILDNKGTTTLANVISLACYGDTRPGTAPNTSWIAGSVVTFVYDGLYWVEISGWDTFSFSGGTVNGSITATRQISADFITSSRYIQAGSWLKANSGSITLRDPHLDRDGTTPSSSQYSYVFGVADKDNELVAYLQGVQSSTGATAASIHALNEKSDGTQVNNSLALSVTKDGTQTYSVSNPAAFRSAIAAASLAANTFSGVQTTNGNQFVGKSTNLTSNTVPSSATNGNGTFRLADSANNTIGYICPHFGTDNIQWLTMYAQRAVSSTAKFSTLRLGVDSSGNARVSLEGTKARQAWNTALRQVLYNNATGTNGNVTLSETAANFNHLTIYYRTNDNFHTSVDVFAPNGKIVSLQSIGVSDAGNNMYLKSRTVTISGTSITKKGEASANLWSSSIGYPGASTDIYITRVEGW